MHLGRPAHADMAEAGPVGDGRWFRRRDGRDIRLVCKALVTRWEARGRRGFGTGRSVRRCHRHLARCDEFDRDLPRCGTRSEEEVLGVEEGEEEMLGRSLEHVDGSRE